MGSSILGAITGGVIGLWQDYQDNRQSKREYNLAQEQLALQKQAAQDEEQARNKAESKSPDIEGILESNTAGGLGATSLTGGTGSRTQQSQLGGGNTLLGL
ncbi:hypothetical protein [Sutterella sp.]|uniref:hypothetical protein n=1 Tax=Sutterella sp. TaxID=1981025 RepID=UPI0026DF82F5|nr:hypothetical protein [Sutterella sp.]MDO5531057.1 hypothetical protein [Sutterella sp.]